MKTPSNPQVVVALLKTAENQYWLLLAQDGERFCIHGWPSIAHAVDYFEAAYNGAHARSYEASMSACINSIEFQPCVAVFQDLQELEQQLLPPADQRRATRISSISGGYNVLKLDPKVAAPFWEKGRKPCLIAA
jgi:hypothetical protein